MSINLFSPERKFFLNEDSFKPKHLEKKRKFSIPSLNKNNITCMTISPEKSKYAFRFSPARMGKCFPSLSILKLYLMIRPLDCYDLHI